MSVVINLPSGTHENYRIWVDKDGIALHMKVEFPREMTNVQTLFADFRSGQSEWNMKQDHPAIGACVRALKAERESAEEAISSIATIPFPMRVESNVMKYCFYWKATYVVFFVLKAAADAYTAGSERKASKDMSAAAVRSGTTNVGPSPTLPPSTPVTPTNR